MTFRSSTAAPQRAATTQRIDVARELLLTPFGLDESHLARALAEIRAHQVDDADLYFQYTRSEGWSLEEGIVYQQAIHSQFYVVCAKYLV